MAAIGFLTPWLLGLLLLTLAPLLASLYLSFTDYDLLSPPRWVGFDNYIEMFTGDSRYIAALKVTLRFVLIAVPCKLALALLVAMALRKSLRGLGLYRTVYYVPSLLGTSVAIAILWRQMFGRDGIVNGILQYVGVSERSWVSSPGTALWTIIILAVWQFGAPMVIFLAGLNAIPRELYEAAGVDGAGTVRRFFHVTVPMLTPIIFFNLVLEIIHSFQVFTSAFVVSGGRGGPIDSTLVYTLYLYQRGFTDFDMGYAAAMAWVLVLIIALFTAILFGTARFWVFYGDRD